MKKSCSLILALIILMSIISGVDLSVYAAGDTLDDFGYCGDMYDNVVYTFDRNSGTLIISGTGNMIDYPILSGSYGSSYIEETQVQKIIIKDGVTSIGNENFKFFHGLCNVTISNTVKRIGENAFYDCYNLTTIQLGNSVETIEKSAFDGCSLKNITIPNSVKKIDSEAFQNNDLTNVKFGNNLTTIGDYAFAWCPLESISLPNSVTSIGRCAFLEFKAKSIIVPKNVKKYGHRAFHSYGYLKTITFYSPDCQIMNDAGSADGDPIDSSVVIYGYDNSTAEKYALKFDVNFVSIGKYPCKTHSYKKTVTKATEKADGKIVDACTKCKTVKSTTAIPKIKSVALSTTATYYNGKVKTPGVTVKDSKGKTLKKGTDYTVSFASGRKNVGRYAVTVTFKGNYSGKKTLYFNIIPRGVSKINSVTPKSKGFVVNWTKQRTQTTGYQIQYSTDKNMSGAKTITMPKNTYYAKNITKLKGNKRYYVRVRTYKVTKFNGKNYNIYSPWCAAKSVTTKK